MSPSGKLRDKKAHERSFLLKARVKKLKAVATYKKERQILAQTAMIHSMTAPKVAKAPGWALRYKTYRRSTDFVGNDYHWKQEKRFDDDPEIYVRVAESSDEEIEKLEHSGESDSGERVIVLEPGHIFASYAPYAYCPDDILIRDKKEFQRRTKNLLGIGPPIVDNTDLAALPRWLSCLHPRRRAEAYAEVKGLIESWDGEEFEFRRTARRFEADKDIMDNRGQFQECIAITVRAIWIERTEPEPVFKEHSVRRTHNQTLVL